MTNGRSHAPHLIPLLGNQLLVGLIEEQCVQRSVRPHLIEQIQSFSLSQWATRSAESQARLHFIPVLEGTDGNLVFEQRSRPPGGHAVWRLLSRGAQEAIGRRCAHREQLVAALLREVQMPCRSSTSTRVGRKGISRLAQI